MESRAKLFGHPIHPMLVVGGLLAAIFGAVDWRAIPSGTRPARG